MTAAGDDHRDPRRVGGCDHLIVFHRTAWLDRRCDAGANSLLQPVGKRKEGVGRHQRAPTPAQSLNSTMALDLTCFTAVQASPSCSHSCSVGCLLVTTVDEARSKPARSHSWTRKPPATVRTS